jgi:hypothetical protein
MICSEQCCFGSEFTFAVLVVLYKELDLHLTAVGSSLIALAQHRDLVERLKETRCVLKGLPLATA